MNIVVKSVIDIVTYTGRKVGYVLKIVLEMDVVMKVQSKYINFIIIPRDFIMPPISNT